MANIVQVLNDLKDLEHKSNDSGLLTMLINYLDHKVNDTALLVTILDILKNSIKGQSLYLREKYNMTNLNIVLLNFSNMIPQIYSQV